MSVKGKMLRMLSGFLKEATIRSVEEVGSDFRRVVLSGEGLPTPEPGSKVQVLLPADEVHTWSPIASSDGLVLLGYVHAPGPGGAWMRSVKVGERVHFAGPQRSLVLPPGPIILVGDETSVAVAAGYETQSRGRVIAAIFEAGNPSGTLEAATAVGLRAVHTASRGDHPAMLEAIVQARASSAEATIALTGGSELVLAIREGLRARGLSDITTKTYWIPGRSGLD